MAHIRRLPNGRWKAEVYLPIRLPNGRFKRATFRDQFKRTVEQQAKALEAKIARGNWTDPGAARQTVAEWADLWQAGEVIEYHTARTRKYRMPRVLDQWGGWELRRVGHMDVQTWVHQMKKEKVGPHAIQAAVQLLGAMMEAAVRSRLIEHNPTVGVKLPPRPPHADRILDLEEEDALMRVLTEPWATLVETFLYTGLRFSEAGGLHRARLNPLRRRLTVCAVLLRDGTIKEYAKSSKGNRDLPLTPDLARRLDQHLSSVPGAECRGGHCPDGTGALAFGAANDGAPLHYENLRLRVWRPALAAARLCGLSAEECAEDHDSDPHHLIPQPWPTIHDLRHTYGTRLAEAGVPVHDIRDLMGHSNIRTTNRYLQSGDDRFDAAVEALSRTRASSTPPRTTQGRSRRAASDS